MPDEPREETEEELERRLRKLLGEAEEAGDEELDQIELKLRDLDDQFEQQKGERKTGDELFDAEFESRLSKLHEKANKAKSVNDSIKREKERNYTADRDSAKGLGMGLTIAYTIIGVPLGGLAIGWAIDSRMGTSSAKGIAVVIGAAIGMALAVVMLNRTNNTK